MTIQKIPVTNAVGEGLRGSLYKQVSLQSRISAHWHIENVSIRDV